MSTNPGKPFRDLAGREYGAEDFVEACLDGSAYGQGELEDMRMTIKNLNAAMARLMAHMHAEGKLDQATVEYIARGY